MIKKDDERCPICGGELRYYDKIKRVIRSKYRLSRKITVRRMKCSNCQSVHREIPVCLFPYKQYEAEMILGVLEGIITSDTYGFEDYPCEITMKRWLSQKTQLLLWK